MRNQSSFKTHKANDKEIELLLGITLHEVQMQVIIILENRMNVYFTKLLKDEDSLHIFEIGKAVMIESAQIRAFSNTYSKLASCSIFCSKTNSNVMG